VASDAKIFTIFEGTSEIQRMIIGREQFDLGAAGDDSFGPSVPEPPDDLHVALPRAIPDHPPDQLVLAAHAPLFTQFAGTS